MSNFNRRMDLNRIERLYRAGLLTIGEIARECSVPESNIRYHAKQKGWKRDLTTQVRNVARTKMVENLAKGVSDDPLGDIARSTDEEIIEQAARTQVEVVRQHQKALGHAHLLTMRMLSELDATTAYKEELQNLISATVAPARQEALRRAVSLGSRATTLRDLATSARLLITLERQAFGIVDETRERDAGQKKLDEMTAEQLRAEIMDDAKRLGLELTSNDFGIAGKQKTNGKVHH